MICAHDDRATAFRRTWPMKGQWGSTECVLGTVENGAEETPWPLAIAKSRSTETLVGPWNFPKTGAVGMKSMSLWSLVHIEVKTV